jgi:hypothetical protein
MRRKIGFKEVFFMKRLGFAICSDVFGLTNLSNLHNYCYTSSAGTTTIFEGFIIANRWLIEKMKG